MKIGLNLHLGGETMCRDVLDVDGRSESAQLAALVNSLTNLLHLLPIRSDDADVFGACPPRREEGNHIRKNLFDFIEVEPARTCLLPVVFANNAVKYHRKLFFLF